MSSCHKTPYNPPRIKLRIAAIKTCVVIPAKDEAPTIQKVIGQVRRHCHFDVIVVDDFSQDGTAELAKQAGATVLTMVQSQGAWLATQAGMRFAVSKGFDCVITMDADGQHRAQDIGLLWDESEDADVVIGACPQRGTWARRLAWRLFKKLTSVSVDDLTSGFRVYKRHALSVLTSRQASLLEFQDMGVLLMLRSAGLYIKEVQVVMGKRESGISRIFSSWTKVLYYMLVTLFLCLVKAIPEEQHRYTRRLKQGL